MAAAAPLERSRNAAVPTCGRTTRSAAATARSVSMRSIPAMCAFSSVRRKRCRMRSPMNGRNPHCTTGTRSAPYWRVLWFILGLAPLMLLGTGLSTWLYRLAVNHCLDVLRGRQTKMQRSTDSLDEEGAIEPAAAMPVVPTAISRLDLDRAIARLPEGCRAAFVLHDVEGLEHHEVASLLGISQGTSKSQVHKARMKLRALLGGAGR